MVLVPWNDVASGALEQFPQPIPSAVGAARSFLCDLRNRYPNFLEGTAPYTALEGVRNAIWGKICPDAPPPLPTNPPPWSGETCACVNYKIRFRITRNGNPLSEGETIPFTGPFYGLEREAASQTTSSTYVRHGTCSAGNWTGTNRFTVLSAGNSDKFEVIGVDRQGGGSTCPVPSPTPIPPPTPPTATDQSRQAPITLAPNVQISVPVILVKPTINTEIKPEFEVNVGPVNVKFDLGGVEVNFSPSYNPTFIQPTVNLPSLPPGQTRPTPLPPSDGGGDCPDPCPDPIEMESITINKVDCELENGEYVVKPKTQNITVLKGEKDAWTELFKQFTEANSRICLTKNNPNVGPNLIGSGITTRQNRTFYFDVSSKTIGVFVKIVSIDKTVSLYVISTPDEEQGKFGNIALCTQGAGGKFYQSGDPGWIWTKGTWYKLPDTDALPKKIRLTLVAGLTFELYDTGERK